MLDGEAGGKLPPVGRLQAAPDLHPMHIALDGVGPVQRDESDGRRLDAFQIVIDILEGRNGKSDLAEPLAAIAGLISGDLLWLEVGIADQETRGASQL